MTFFIHFFREERGRERERGRGVTKHLFNYSFLNWRIITYSAIFFFFRFWFCFKIRQSINSQEKENGKKKFIISMFFCLFVWFVFFIFLIFVFQKTSESCSSRQESKAGMIHVQTRTIQVLQPMSGIGGGETGSNQKCTCFILLLTCTARGI